MVNLYIDENKDLVMDTEFGNCYSSFVICKATKQNIKKINNKLNELSREKKTKVRNI